VVVLQEPSGAVYDQSLLVSKNDGELGQAMGGFVVLNPYALAVIGLAASAVILLLAAAKWKIPLRVAGLGGAGVLLLAAVPFLWVYPACSTTGTLIAAFFGQVTLTLGLAAASLMFAFWRDPERVPPETSGVILSAADGRVAYITAIDDSSVPLVTKHGQDYRLEELIGTSLVTGPAWVIGVEMHFLNVHVNRCPIEGQVRLVKHMPGRFLSLRKDEAPFVNERLTTVIEGSKLSVGVIQVASRLVRRIQGYLSLGQRVDAAQRLCMIRFGSLVAVVLPQRHDILSQAKVGDRVMAGISVLARYGVSDDTSDRKADA
jgi:phosphatidylserine decarboxylase